MDIKNMDDIKVYNQTLKELQSHIPFLSDIIKKIKTGTETQQGKFLSELEKLYQHANSKELKLKYMIKIEKTIRKLKEKYESKILDSSTRKTNIQTTELTEKDKLNDKAFVSESISETSTAPSTHYNRASSIEIPKLDKYGLDRRHRNDRNGSQDKSDRFSCDSGDRYSSRNDKWLKPRDRFKLDCQDRSSGESDRNRDKYRARKVTGETGERTDRESGSDYKIGMICDSSPAGCQNNSKFVANPFRTKIAKVSSADTDVGCDSDNEDSRTTKELRKLREARTKLLNQLVEMEKRNEHKPSTAKATSSELPISELKISSTTPPPKTGLKIKLDLLKQREASKDEHPEEDKKHPCMSANGSGTKDSARFSFMETFNQTSKSTQKYTATSTESPSFTPIDDDIITKIIIQPINEKNDVASSISKGFTIANSISDAVIMDVVKHTRVTTEITKEVTNHGGEIAANTGERNSLSDSERLPFKYNRKVRADQQITEIHQQSEVTHSNNFVDANDTRLSSVTDPRIKAFTPPVRSEFRSSLNIERKTYGSRPINSRHSLDYEKNNAPMTYGEYKRRQQATVSSTSTKFEKKKTSTPREDKRSPQAAVSSRPTTFNKNKVPKTFSKYKRSEQTIVSSLPKKLDKDNATNIINSDISKSHLDNIYRSGNFSTKPNLSDNKFKIPKKKHSGANSNDFHSNQQSSSSLEVKDLVEACEVSGNVKGVINCNIQASECRGDPQISGNDVKKTSALDGKNMNKSPATEMQNVAVTLLADNQSTVTKEAMESMLKQFMNPNNLLTLITLRAQLSDDEMLSKIKDIILHSNETNQSSSIEESAEEPPTMVEVEKDVPKTTRRKNELDRLNEDIRDSFISESVMNATGQRMCAVYKKANKESPATLVNTETQENRSKDNGADVNQRFVELPTNGARTIRRSNTMIGYKATLRRYMRPPAGHEKGKSRIDRIHETKTAKITNIIESNDGDKEKSLRVTQLRQTKECAVVLQKLHPSATVESLVGIASLKKDEGGKRRINEEEDEAQTIETRKKKRLSPQKEVIKNNNPDWHCLNKTTKCQLCEKSSGISLVSHYVNNHPYKEVIPSRVAPDVADFLRNSTKVHKVERFAPEGKIQHQFKQRCYFCNKTKSLQKTIWIQHMGVHTGCYQYKCIDCNRKFSSSPKQHECKGTSKNKIVKESLPKLDREEVFGYLCDICNFVRFDENEMVNHLCSEHEGNVTTKFKKVIFLRFPNVKMKKNRQIESNTVEQMDTSDSDSKAHIDSIENISRRRSKSMSNMDNDDTELDREKITDKEPVKTESLDPLTCDEGIPIIIKTQTDDDDLGNTVTEAPNDKATSSTQGFVREHNCTPAVIHRLQDNITVKEEEENSGPTEFETKHSENMNVDTVNWYLNEDDEMGNPTKVFIQVYNIGYLNSFDLAGNCITFSCLIDQCGFETMHLASLLSHIEDHTEKWCGFCFTCNTQVINNQVPLMMEFKHLTEAHLNEIDNHNCGDNSGERTHFIKCKFLPGDQLSTLQAEIAATEKRVIIQDVTPSSTFVCDNDFMKITNPMSEDSEVIALKQWTRNPTSKLQSYCKSMMREMSMFALFKCMDIECSFTTNNAELMLAHLQKHENHAGSQVNPYDAHSWLECAYCDEIGDSCLLLVQHIQNEHQSSVFQCPYCFYRSIAAYNVIVHLSQFHSTKQKSVLVCNGKTKRYATETTLIEKSRKEFVRPLRCSEECQNFTFIMDYFVQHMKSSPIHSDKFKCQFCGFNILITEAAKHLLCHRVGVFECIYCHYGTNDIENIKKHMCNSHPSKLLYICVRLTRKFRVLTDEQRSSVESTLMVDISQSVDAKLFRRSPYPDQQSNFICPSIDMNSNVNSAMESARVPRIQPITCVVPINDEIPAVSNISNETFSSTKTLGSSSERETRLMFTEILSYKDVEEYISNDYDKYFASLPIELTRKSPTPSILRPDLVEAQIDVAVYDSDLEGFEGF